MERNVKRKSTQIVAKYDTVCPQCFGMLRKGEYGNVHDGKWMHTSCFMKFVNAKEGARVLAERLQKAGAVPHRTETLELTKPTQLTINIFR